MLSVFQHGLFQGSKKAWATLRSVCFRGLIQNFRRASPPFSYAESPPPPGLHVPLWIQILIFSCSQVDISLFRISSIYLLDRLQLLVDAHNEDLTTTAGKLFVFINDILACVVGVIVQWSSEIWRQSRHERRQWREIEN